MTSEFLLNCLLSFLSQKAEPQPGRHTNADTGIRCGGTGHIRISTKGRTCSPLQPRAKAFCSSGSGVGQLWSAASELLAAHRVLAGSGPGRNVTVPVRRHGRWSAAAPSLTRSRSPARPVLPSE